MALGSIFGGIGSVAAAVSTGGLSIWAQLAVSFAVSLASSLLMSMVAGTPKSTKPTNAVAGTVEIPETKEGTGVVHVFGTICIKSPSIVHYGSQFTTPIVEVFSGGGGSKK